MSLLITGGTVVGADRRRTRPTCWSTARRSPRCSAPGLRAGSSRRDEVIDATGKYVIPGGIDAHTHMELPFGGTFASDTFETGTRAAAWGGTTTIIDFAVQRTGEVVQDGLAAWHAKADGNCHIDYGVPHDPRRGRRRRRSRRWTRWSPTRASRSFKLFMAYPGVFYSDDGQILRAMQKARENGAMIMMHAENGIAIDVLVQQALARGETDPIYHGLTRPAALEAEATRRAIALAEVARDCPLYIVHLSASRRWRRWRRPATPGRNVFAETCPQYLYLTLEDQLGAPGFEGAKWVCSTPLRSKHESPPAGPVAGPAHATTCRSSRPTTARSASRTRRSWACGDFSKIPNGIGGVEHRVDLLYQGVVDGQLSLERWVETIATTPARMFGLYPRKGVIAPGSDADIVVYDPDGRTRISVETHHMNMDHSAYEGYEIAGQVDTVHLPRRGRWSTDGDYHGRKGHGRYLRRGLSPYLL